MITMTATLLVFKIFLRSKQLDFSFPILVSKTYVKQQILHRAENELGLND